jgi:hypothetical protein
MFGLFGGAKKKRLLKSIALVDRCAGLLRVQVDSPEAVERRRQLHTPFAYGYIFGFADAVFIKEGVTADRERHGDIASLFESLFGPNAGSLAIDQCIASMQEEAFVRGRLLGGQEVFDLAKSRGEQIPTGLTKYLLGQQAG